MSYSVEQIAEVIKARRVGDTPATIDWLLTDSRSLSFPEETLFFALATRHGDGACYIPELLEQLQSRGFQLAVASNKYQAATEKLIVHYFPNIRFKAVFGQREGIPVKPDPTIVEDILALTKIAHEDVLYVGDSAVDMQTAINARVTACGVTWGFRPRAELEAYNPRYMVDCAEEILHLLTR